LQKQFRGEHPTYYPRMPSNNPSDGRDSGDAPTVPAGVPEGVKDVLYGRTADGEDLDEALGL